MKVFVVLTKLEEKWGGWSVDMAIFGPQFSKIVSHMLRGANNAKKYGSIQSVLDDDLYSVVKPWPFRGWAIDLIGKIYPASSKGHSFMIVATDYFTKWVEAIPMKKVEQKDVISFIKEHIIHRFGIPQTITTD